MPDKPRHSRQSLSGAATGKLDVLLFCGVVALLAAVVSTFAWTRATRTGVTLSYTQEGNLSYSAPAALGSVYGAGGLTTGEPVYTNLVKTIAVRYSYRFSSSASAVVGGTEQLVATVADGMGITQTVPLQAVTAFNGSSFNASGELQLSAIEAIANSFAAASSRPYDGSYSVQISPRVRLSGQLGHAPVNEHFDPPANFTISSSVLLPSSSDNASPSATQASSPSPASRFSTSTNGSVVLPEGRPAVLVHGLKVGVARIAGLLLLGLALLVAWIIGRPLLDGASSGDERVRIATRYGSMLVNAETLPERPDVAIVDVASFDGVLQVARRLELPIMHHSGRRDVYAVVDSGTLYRYGVGVTKERLKEPQQDPWDWSSHGRPRNDERWTELLADVTSTNGSPATHTVP